MSSNTYSFINTQCSLVGPGGNINLGQGAAVGDEGIKIAPTGDVNTMTIGADGTPMHSLHADHSGMVSVQLLKTSPVNQLLAEMYGIQTSSSVMHGQNVISLTNNVTGDTIVCTFCAFKKAPELEYKKEGGFNVWEFQAGVISRVLGGNT